MTTLSQTIKQKIEKLQEKLRIAEAKEQTEKNKVDFIVIDGWAYETKEHDFNKQLGGIKIPEGKELWLPSECFKFYENKTLRNKLNLNDCWFFVKQVRDNTTDVARFNADSGWASLYCNRNPDYHDAGLGVRFKWKVKHG